MEIIKVEKYFRDYLIQTLPVVIICNLEHETMWWGFHRLWGNPNYDTKNYIKLPKIYIFDPLNNKSVQNNPKWRDHLHNGGKFVLNINLLAINLHPLEEEL